MKKMIRASQESEQTKILRWIPEACQVLSNVCNANSNSDLIAVLRNQDPYYAEVATHEGKAAVILEIVNSISKMASEYSSIATNTYVVKIWHEVEGARGGLPSAAEEVLYIEANTEREALDKAEDGWDGPIDRIEVIGINPEDDEMEDLPF